MKEHKEQPKEDAIHDEVSPIIITETEPVAQFNQLWKYLVPACGRRRF